MSENILAIDVGTQSCRASVVTAAGEIVGIAQIAHEVDSPQPGWAQQRPDDWWDETARAIAQVLGESTRQVGDVWREDLAGKFAQ